MNFLEIAKKRYSLKKYSPKRVDPDKIQRCIEAARIAPSASNSQPWFFVVVNEEKTRTQVAKTTLIPPSSLNKFALQAPVIIAIVTGKPTLSAQIGGHLKGKDFTLIDVGIAAEHFCLQAASEGLGTCMIGWFNEKAVKKILQVPPKKHIYLLITLGYPEKEIQKKKKRKPIEEIFSYNIYK